MSTLDPCTFPESPAPPLVNDDEDVEVEEAWSRMVEAFELTDDAIEYVEELDELEE